MRVYSNKTIRKRASKNEAFGRTRNILICLTAVCLCGIKPLYAQTHISQIKDKETLAIIKSARPSVVKPYVPVFVLLWDEQHSIKDNHTVVSKKHVIVKVLREKGREAGVVNIPFNEYFETLRITKARVISPGGAIQKVPETSIKELTSFIDMPLLRGFKIKKIIFPEVGPGSIIEYETVTVKTNKTLPGISLLFTMPQNRIVARARFSVSVPKNMPVKFKAERFSDNEPAVSEIGNHKKYSWQINHPFVHGAEEPNPLNSMEGGPYVVFSTIDSWQKVYDWGVSLTQGQLSADKAIEDKVTELIKGRKYDKKGMIEPLFKYVSQNVKTAGVELGTYSSRPYPASEVLKNGYADCKGKTALLIAMLRAVGIPAYPALLMNNNAGFIVDSVPVTNFNNMITAIPDKDGYIFLDATAELLPLYRLPYYEQGCDALILKEGGPEEFVRTPQDLPQQNKLERICRVSLFRDYSIEIKETYSCWGQLEWPNRILVKNTTVKKYKQLFEESLKSISTSFRLTGFDYSDYRDLKNPFTINSSYTINDYAEKNGKLYYFVVPITDPLPENLFYNQSRHSPLNLDFPFTKTEKFIITLPNGYKLKQLPKPLTLEDKSGFFNKEFSSEGNKILVEARWSLKTSEITPVRYISLKRMMERIKKSNDEPIVLEE